MSGAMPGNATIRPWNASQQPSKSSPGLPRKLVSAAPNASTLSPASARKAAVSKMNSPSITTNNNNNNATKPVNKSASSATKLPVSKSTTTSTPGVGRHLSNGTYRVPPKKVVNSQLDEITVSLMVEDERAPIRNNPMSKSLMENRAAPRVPTGAAPTKRGELSPNLPTKPPITSPATLPKFGKPSSGILNSHQVPLHSSSSGGLGGPRSISKPAPPPPHAPNALQTYRSQPNLANLPESNGGSRLMTTTPQPQTLSLSNRGSPQLQNWPPHASSPRVSPWLTKQLHHDDGPATLFPPQRPLTPAMASLSRSTPFILDEARHETLLKKTAHRNAATDTFELDRIRNEEIRQLHDRIEDLECDNRVKEREIGTNRWVEKEMQRHLKTTEELMDLKSQLRESERQLSVQQRINKQLMDENGRLFDEISEKDRFIRQLQTEVDNLDRIITNKASLNESEIIQRLQNDLDHSHLERDRLAQSLASSEQEMQRSQKETEQKSREIKFKNDEIQNLQKQVYELQNAVEDLDRERILGQETMKLSEREKHLLEEQAAKVLDVKALNAKLIRENDELRSEIQALESKCQLLEGDREEKSRLKDLVDDMKIMLGDKKLAERENANLGTQLREMEGLLKDRAVEEEALQREVSHLKQFCQQLEKENAYYQDYEQRFHKEKQAHDATLQEKEYLQSKLEQLQPKLAHLLDQSREKDRVMTKLIAELSARGDFVMPSMMADISRVSAPVLPPSSKSRLTRDDDYGSLPPTRNMPTASSLKSPTDYSLPKSYNKTEIPLYSDGGHGAGNTSDSGFETGHLAPADSSRLPDAPHTFQVKRMGGQSIMLQWVAPYMDELDRNHGHQLSGYKIYVNNAEHQSIGSPRLTKTYLNGVTADELTVFAIETVASNNLRSQRVETTLRESEASDFTHMIGGENWSLQAANGGSGGGGLSSNAIPGDLTSSRENIAASSGSWRSQMMQVTSDFHPQEDTMTQIPIKTGEKVRVLGKAKSDGFILIEKNGRKGFVPSQNLKAVLS